MATNTVQDLLRSQAFLPVWLIDAVAVDPAGVQEAVALSSAPYRTRARDVPAADVVRYRPALAQPLRLTQRIHSGLGTSGGAQIEAELIIENEDRELDRLLTEVSMDGLELLVRLAVDSRDQESVTILAARVTGLDPTSGGTALTVTLLGLEEELRARAFRRRRFLGLGRAVDFSTSGTLTVDYDPGLDPRDGFFFSLWYRPQAWPRCTVMRHGTRIFRVDDRSVLTWSDSATGLEVTCSDLIARPGEWQSVALHWDGTALTCYLDGVKSVFSVAVPSLTVETSAIEIGLGTDPIAGLATHILYFSERLTEDEIAIALESRPDQDLVLSKASFAFYLESGFGAIARDETHHERDGTWAAEPIWTESGTGPLGLSGVETLVVGTRRGVPTTPLTLDGKLQSIATGPLRGIGAVEIGERRLWVHAARQGVIRVLSAPPGGPTEILSDRLDLAVFAPGQTVEIELAGVAYAGRTVVAARSGRLLVSGDGIPVSSARATVRSSAPVPDSLAATFSAAAGTVTGPAGTFRHRRAGQTLAVSGSGFNDKNLAIALDPAEPWDVITVVESLEDEVDVAVTLTWEEAFDATDNLARGELVLANPGAASPRVEVHGIPGPSWRGWKWQLRMEPGDSAEAPHDSRHDAVGTVTLVWVGVVDMIETAGRAADAIEITKPPAAAAEPFAEPFVSLIEKGSNYSLSVSAAGAVGFTAGGITVKTADLNLPQEVPVVVAVRVGATARFYVGSPGDLSIPEVGSQPWAGVIAPDPTAPFRLGAPPILGHVAVWAAVVLGSDTNVDPMAQPIDRLAGIQNVIEYYRAADPIGDGTATTLASSVTGIELQLVGGVYEWIVQPPADPSSLAHVTRTLASYGGLLYPDGFHDDLSDLEAADQRRAGLLVAEDETLGQALDRLFVGTDYRWRGRLGERRLDVVCYDLPDPAAQPIALRDVRRLEALTIPPVLTGVRITYGDGSDQILVGDETGHTEPLEMPYVDAAAARAAGEEILARRTKRRVPWRCHLDLADWRPDLARLEVELDTPLLPEGHPKRYRVVEIGFDGTEGILIVELRGGDA